MTSKQIQEQISKSAPGAKDVLVMWMIGATLFSSAIVLLILTVWSLFSY